MVDWQDIYDQRFEDFDKYCLVENFSEEQRNAEHDKFIQVCKDEADKITAFETDEKFTISKEDFDKIKNQAKFSSDLSLKEKWSKLFSKRSYCNELMGEIFYYVFCSLLFKNIDIDRKNQRLQLHSWILQDSGTGKDQAMDFFLEMIMKYNERVFSSNDSNEDIKLVPIKCYEMNGNESPEVLLDHYAAKKKGNGVDFNTPIPGILSSHDFLYSRECSYYFTEKRGEKQNKREILLEALEGKKMTKALIKWEGHPTITQCKASYVGCSRPFENIKEHIVNSGLQQRGVSYCREVDIDLRQKMNKMVSQYSFVTEEEYEKFEKEQDEFITEIFSCCMALHKKKVVSEDKKTLNNLINDNLLGMYRDVSDNMRIVEHRNIMSSFIARYKDLVITIAYLNAMSNKRQIMTVVDLQVAFELIKKTHTQMMLWVESKIPEEENARRNYEKFYKMFAGYFGRNKETTADKKDLAKEMSKKLRISESHAYKVIRDYSEGQNSLLISEGNKVCMRQV